MIRKIVNIDREKCNGCGLCITACHEGAIELVDGKAEIIHDKYCDGLGDCLPNCPVGAITIIERETVPYDEEAVEMKKAEKEKKKSLPNIGMIGFGKPWPVQLKLVNVNSPFFKDANLLIAADCTAYAYKNFHEDFMKGHVTLIGCPKLDDNQYYKEKLTEIITNNSIKSITVAKMEVPCCNGITTIVKAAIEKSGKKLDYKEVTITI